MGSFFSQTEVKRSNAWAIFIGAAGGSTYGYPAAIIAGITGEPHWVNHSSGELGFLATSIVIGMAIGSTFAAYITDMIGRKKVAILSALFSTIFGVLTAVMRNLWVLSVMRIIQGLFIGGVSSVSPPYVSELATDQYRATLVTIYQLSVIGSMVIARVFNIWFDYVDDGWQYEFGLASFFSAVMFVGCLFIPESPSWITKHQQLTATEAAATASSQEEGKEQEAQEVEEEEKEEQQPADEEEEGENPRVSSAAGDDEEPQENDDKKPKKKAKKAAAKPAAQKKTDDLTMGERLKLLMGHQKKQLVVALILAVNLQMTGVNAIGSFAPATIAAAGVEDRMDTLVISLALIVWDLFAVASSVYSVRKFDCRTLLIIGSIITVVGLLMVTIVYMVAPDDFDDSTHSRTASVTLAILGIAIFLFGFQFGVAPTYYVLITDIFTDAVRGIGSPAAMTVCWLCNIIVVQVYLPLVDAIGQGPTFIIFLAFAVFSVFFNFFIVRTTRNIEYTGK